MGLHNRKLIEFDRASAPISETLEQICELSCDPSSNSTYCLSPCSRICPNICHDDDSSLYPPPTSASHSFHPNKLFIASFTLLAVTFFALFCYAFYVKRFKRSGRPQTEQDEFIDEDHGPVIDHPIWYINTVGLPAAVIDSIAVLKYRKGDGVVDGTDCSVCLSEFQEDETLRLLPKCSHAFHISCIDTWLRSHTNCPICRAPIVATGAVQAEGGEPSGSGETRVDIPEENEQERRQSPGVGSGGVERRWASLDFSEAPKMGKAVAGSGSSEESNSGGGDLKRVGRSQSLLRFVGSSLQSGPDFLKRSVSCYGEFSLPAESESSSGPSSSASSSSSSSSSPS